MTGGMSRSEELGECRRFWIEERQSVPGFLAQVTTEMFEKTTVSQRIHVLVYRRKTGVVGEVGIRMEGTTGNVWLDPNDILELILKRNHICLLYDITLFGN